MPEQILADAELLNPQPEDDPGFQPYPQPYTDQPYTHPFEPPVRDAWPPYAHDVPQAYERPLEHGAATRTQIRPLYAAPHTHQPQQHGHPGE